MRTSPTEASALTHDALWPRDEQHRYRLYGRVGRALTVLAAAPDPGGIGQAIVTLHADAKEAGGSLGDSGQIGVLDTLPEKVMYDSDGHRLGEWIVLPWSRSARRWKPAT